MKYLDKLQLDKMTNTLSYTTKCGFVLQELSLLISVETLKWWITQKPLKSYDIKVDVYCKLTEYMAKYMYQRSRSFFDLCQRSLRMKLDLRWAVQDHWSSGYLTFLTFLPPLRYCGMNSSWFTYKTCVLWLHYHTCDLFLGSNRAICNFW